MQINPFTYVRTRRRAQSAVSGLGRSTLDFFRATGEGGVMLGQVTRALFHRTDRPRREIISTQLYHIGYLSLPVVLVTGASMGMVMAVQSYATLHRFNAEAMCGPMINYSVVSQIGPSMTALLVAGRAGSNIAAELGTMKVTEQIDALRVMGTNPIKYLVAPRVLACTALMPVLGALAGVVGIFSGAFLCIAVWDVDQGAYWYQANKYVQKWDVFMGLAKCPFFGALIGIVSCRQGMMTGGGATGVGQSCTRAVVQASLLVLVMNFLLTLVSNELYDLFYGE
ncbi:MAG: ABC transporter permease [Planctomycetes bacterium]|nr:ABC transporter permease [Planctomycetota bacterium]